MTTLTDFQENYGTLAYDLIDHQSRHDYEKDRAKGQDEVELASEDVIIRLGPKV